MSNETIQEAFDEIAAHLKANGTKIGSREAYSKLNDLTGHLNRQGFDIAPIAGWDDDITDALRPGFKDLAEQKGRSRKRF